jgi:hypothetical protein
LSDRLVICSRCSAVIQQGSGPPCPDLCEGCRENDRKDAGHELEVISLGEIPAAICGCGRWGYSTSTRHGDTNESKRKIISEAHAKHVEEAA